ncbi:MAG: DNA polymerase/3'-5' exonuclease PolX [Isosphaeraceae bacterium]
MQTAQVARVLEQMGTLMEVRGENPFRCRAYHNAAQALRGLPDDLAEMIAQGRLKDVPGIGEAIHQKIVTLVTTGSLPAFDALKSDTPPGLVALLRVPGLGPKKIKQLHDELKITSLADLRLAAESGKIAGLKGFGTKAEAKIKEGIAFLEKAGDRILQSTARRLAEPLLAAVRSSPGVIRAEVCGSLRRRAETSGDLDIVFASDSPADVLAAFAKRPEVEEVLGLGETKASVRVAGGVQCDVRGVAEVQYPFALHYFTGSKAHNIAMRRRAIAHGYKLSEYGLEGPDGWIPCEDEAALFEALGLSYIPPELREGMDEIELAAVGPLPKLVETADLQGTFHCHTDWSDGANTLEQMAEAARSIGLKYLGIADHSRAAAYAGGLSIERVHQQWAAIDALNASYGGSFRLFKGTECDILADGTLDFPDDVLAGFDYVVASVHSGFQMGVEEMTARIVRAVRHPLVTMLGHASGRLLLARDSYAVDLDAVIDAAAGSGTLIEINASPYRLDLDWEHCRKAKAQGVGLVINPDAHSTGGLADLDYGVGVARRAGLGARDVFNTRSPDAVASALRGKARR